MPNEYGIRKGAFFWLKWLKNLKEKKKYTKMKEESNFYLVEIKKTDNNDPNFAYFANKNNNV